MVDRPKDFKDIQHRPPYKNIGDIPEHVLRQNVRYFINVMIPGFKAQVTWPTSKINSSIEWARFVLNQWQHELVVGRGLMREPEKPIPGYDFNKDNGLVYIQGA